MVRFVRRWVVRGILLAGLVVAGLAALLWFHAFPHWRPSLEAGERYGVDVASHQGDVDWEAVADDGIEFAYVKASEGRDFTDRTFAANWEGAAAAGLDRGAYHFFTLCSPGAAQAEHFLSTVPPDAEALPPAVDLELAGNCSERPPEADVSSELDAFLERVERAWGRPVVLYVGDDWEGAYPARDLGDRPTWHRRIARRPSGDWWIWQVSGTAEVDGVDGAVDLNVMRPSD